MPSTFEIVFGGILFFLNALIPVGALVGVLLL